MRIADRLARLERAARPAEVYPSLSDLPWGEIIARLPVQRMYPNNPELWGRP